MPLSRPLQAIPECFSAAVCLAFCRFFGSKANAMGCQVLYALPVLFVTCVTALPQVELAALREIFQVAQLQWDPLQDPCGLQQVQCSDLVGC